jgi:hypothetical protein
MSSGRSLPRNHADRSRAFGQFDLTIQPLVAARVRTKPDPVRMTKLPPSRLQEENRPDNENPSVRTLHTEKQKTEENVHKSIFLKSVSEHVCIIH